MFLIQGKCVEEAANTTFFFFCKLITTQTGTIILIDPNLSGAYYTVRSVVNVSNTDSLKSIYVTYLNSVVKCGIIFGGTISNIGKIFTIQKKIFQNYG